MIHLNQMFSTAVLVAAFAATGHARQVSESGSTTPQLAVYPAGMKDLHGFVTNEFVEGIKVE